MINKFAIILILLLLCIQSNSQFPQFPHASYNSYNYIDYNNKTTLNKYNLISEKIKKKLLKNYHKPQNYKSKYIEVVFEPLKSNLITNIALIDFYRYKTLPVFKNLYENELYRKNFDTFYFIDGFVFDSLNTNTIGDIHFKLFSVGANPNLLVYNYPYDDYDNSYRNDNRSPILNIIIQPELNAELKNHDATFHETYKDKNELLFIKPATPSFCLNAWERSKGEFRIDSIFFLDSIYENEEIGILNVFKTTLTYNEPNGTYRPCVYSWATVTSVYKYHIFYNKKDWAIVKYIQERKYLNTDGKSYREILEFNYKKVKNYYYPDKFRAILGRYDLNDCSYCNFSKDQVNTFIVLTNEQKYLNKNELRNIKNKNSYNDFCPKVDVVNKDVKDMITKELNAMLKDYSFFCKN